MGKPLILFGLAGLANPSFEADSAGTAPPTGWADASTGGLNQVVADHAHETGDGIASAQSLRQNVADGTAGNVSRLRQRIDVSAVPSWLRGDRAPRYALLVMRRCANDVASRNALPRVRQFGGAGATSTPGTGTEYSATARRIHFWGGGEWSLGICSVELGFGVTHLDLELVYDPARAGYTAAADVWWDRAMAGHLVDLSRGFRKFDLKVDSGYRANEGLGVSEIVQVAGPRTEIRADLRNLLADTPDELQARALARWLCSTPGHVALWQDRELHTNEERHFERCYVDPKRDTKYPAGITRRRLSLKLIAPAEGH